MLCSVFRAPKFTVSCGQRFFPLALCGLRRRQHRSRLFFSGVFASCQCCDLDFVVDSSVSLGESWCSSNIFVVVPLPLLRQGCGGRIPAIEVVRLLALIWFCYFIPSRLASPAFILVEEIFYGIVILKTISSRFGSGDDGVVGATVCSCCGVLSLVVNSSCDGGCCCDLAVALVLSFERWCTILLVCAWAWRSLGSNHVQPKLYGACTRSPDPTGLLILFLDTRCTGGSHCAV